MQKIQWDEKERTRVVYGISEGYTYPGAFCYVKQ